MQRPGLPWRHLLLRAQRVRTEFCAQPLLVLGAGGKNGGRMARCYGPRRRGGATWSWSRCRRRVAEVPWPYKGSAPRHAPQAALLRLVPRRVAVPPRRHLRVRPFEGRGADSPPLVGAGAAGARGPHRAVLHVPVQNPLVPNRGSARLADLRVRTQLPGRPTKRIHWLRSTPLSILGEKGPKRGIRATLPFRPPLPVFPWCQGAALPPAVFQNGDLPRPSRKRMSTKKALRFLPQARREAQTAGRRYRLRSPIEGRRAPTGLDLRLLVAALPRCSNHGVRQQHRFNAGGRGRRHFGDECNGAGAGSKQVWEDVGPWRLRWIQHPGAGVGHPSRRG
mmetsp:Transcript_81907/g.228265  ORF Transcript_81907/g.228265 Transcript_81907/m.228265 type:complete len:335 (-) Transcript_81907:440-1444(-)